MSAAIRLACTCLLAGAMTSAWAADTIFMCVDAKGRRLTSERPIPECADREQKEFNPSGTLRRVVQPQPTPAERAAQEARERAAAEQQQRLAEQKRREKLLLTRYPSQGVFDAERTKTLQPITNAPERARIEKRFDEDLARLKPLWAQSETAANGVGPVNR